MENSSGGPIEYWAGLVEEKIDLIEEYQPTVILGRHVLEHVSSPFSLLQTLLERLSGNLMQNHLRNVEAFNSSLPPILREI